MEKLTLSPFHLRQTRESDEAGLTGDPRSEIKAGHSDLSKLWLNLDLCSYLLGSTLEPDPLANKPRVNSPRAIVARLVLSTEAPLTKTRPNRLLYGDCGCGRFG